jgi:hypothetical protein
MRSGRLHNTGDNVLYENVGQGDLRMGKSLNCLDLLRQVRERSP